MSIVREPIHNAREGIWDMQKFSNVTKNLMIPTLNWYVFGVKMAPAHELIDPGAGALF